MTRLAHGIQGAVLEDPKKKLLMVLSPVAVFPPSAYGFGEIFKIETSGTEHCDDFNAVSFGSGNNIDLWVQVVSDSELTVSITQNFAPGTTFPMLGHTYLTGATGASFVGGVLFEDGSFAQFRGNANFDRRTGAIASLKGTFIQSGVFDINCFSSGKFTRIA